MRETESEVTLFLFSPINFNLASPARCLSFPPHYLLCPAAPMLPKEPLCERLPPPPPPPPLPPPGVETFGEEGLELPGERTLALAVRRRSPWLVLALSAAAPLPMSADMPAIADVRPSSEEAPAL